MDYVNASCHPTFRFVIIHNISLYTNSIVDMLFLAVKCNDDVNVIKLLSYLGAGFDCASKVKTSLVECFVSISSLFEFSRVKSRK